MYPETTDGVVRIRLLDCSQRHPLDAASRAARTCYEPTMPEDDRRIDVKKRLFDPGHHTTLQHWYATFEIEGVAVGDVTFGLHLANLFYNTDQRSGRFCSAMFATPDYEALRRYVCCYWPGLHSIQEERIMDYLRRAISVYQKYLSATTELAKKYLAEERPRMTPKALEAMAPKVAQEQMRMSIPLIFPTGLEYTLNLSALVAMWTAAWNPFLRSATNMMRDLILAKYPDIDFMFDVSRRSVSDWSPRINPLRGCLTKPECGELIIRQGVNFREPTPQEMHPVDLLYFTPEMMENNNSFIGSFVHISCATMGQDQRHRTIHRGAPVFSGYAYLPPLLAGLDLGQELLSVMRGWQELAKQGIPGTLMTALAPYGAMVQYHKLGDLNAIAHEMSKRLCWCAQEEIFHLSRQLAEGVGDTFGQIFAPPCVRAGVCGEGARYCGRVMSRTPDVDRRV